MKAEVKSIISPDILDFKDFYPDDDKCFSFLLQLEVGEKGKAGGDVFNVEVCTPQWLLQNYEASNVIFGRGKLIVFEYDIERIFNKLKEYLESCTGSTWDELVTKLSFIGLWEFENYRSDR